MANWLKLIIIHEAFTLLNYFSQLHLVMHLPRGQGRCELMCKLLCDFIFKAKHRIFSMIFLLPGLCAHIHFAPNFLILIDTTDSCQLSKQFGKIYVNNVDLETFIKEVAVWYICTWMIIALETRHWSTGELL